MTFVRPDQRSRGADGPGEPELDDEVELPHRRRSRLLWVTLGVLVLGGAGAGYWLLTQDDGAEATDESAGPVATAEVSRQTLSATESFGGTLGYGEGFSVTAAGQGTVTGVADQGAEISRGSSLYRLDERPVTALFGPLPMYRNLQTGTTGVDVEQLETNLAELGYTATVDDEFTAETAAAVRGWQADLGVPETGVVLATDVVFVPRNGRVDTVHTEVGGRVSPGAVVLDITGSNQIVSLEVDVEDRGLLPVDAQVAVQLPGGEEVSGTVTSANVVAAPPAEGESAGPGAEDEAAGSDDAVTEVEVTVVDPVDESWLGSPVDIVVDVDRREDVLVVPVNALLALTDGDHGLEIVAEDGTTSTVPVETGLFADGMVEVQGEGIEEGTVVGVAGR